MKKFIPILIFILILAGCTFKPYESTDIKNDLELSTSGENILKITDVVPSNYGTINDVDPSTGDVEGVIYIYFNDYLLNSTVTTTNFVLSANGSSGDVSNLNVVYEPDFKRVKITATFADNATYTLAIKNGVKSTSNSFLDGNGNNIDDGTPYDNVLYQFSTGTGSDFVDYDNPIVLGVFPEEGNISINTHFYVDLSELAESSKVVNSTKLYKINDDGSKTELDIELVGYSYIWWLGVWEAEFQPKNGDPLAERRFYQIEVTCSTITDSAGNKALPYFDDVFKPSIKNYTSTFLTESNGGDDDRPPKVNGVNISYGSPLLTIRFNDNMDITKLTTSNIKVFAYINGNYTYIPGSISVSPDTTEVEYSLINLDWDNTSSVYLYVSKEVTDNSDKKWKLDTNGNDIGGESYDPTRVSLWSDFSDSDDYYRQVW
ncbi:MAG: hypothetical protein XD76_0486 [candidate division TA06 bacterium 32_111]|uniref:SbsA Ig-like domain-containing protein n=2 Tax=Bacteria candidate phyla TaxID=1783234 RepID=A0A101I267_UNCT6|nr:MAG: hypothetical protein XD76_0486 [candidate division TA06 bacterium 32_111]KUK87378.1 MAG: hypothetical protein XE03_0776 [candidate division TA06 bacterium 34_109]HAF07788.1 hypothetical protein [candidate division WOR-3 bacterium]HCP17306.1 hypothetical protein [candidate division WOR-3 bacterium]